jgi:hypothetical protein
MRHKVLQVSLVGDLLLQRMTEAAQDSLSTSVRGQSLIALYAHLHGLECFLALDHDI